jgi:hypothetical protein
VDQTHATSEEKRSALHQALQSKTLARTDRLKNLLRFLCESEINGRASELNEYVIGVEALGQPQRFSPSENSAVRSRIFELRQRLEKFYSAEAPDAPLLIELAKGSYVPKFVRRERAAAPLPVRVGTRLWWIAAAAFLAGAALTAVLMRGTSPHASAAAGWTPELEKIWSPFFAHGTPVMLSFESRLFVRIGSVNVRDWTVDEMARVESSARLMEIKDLFHQQQLYENRNYADFGTVQAAFEIARLLGSRNPHLVMKRSSELAPDDARDDDLIVLSKPSTDPALRALLARGPYVDERLRVRNLDPKPGEQAEYDAVPDPKDPDRSGVRYLLITLMPGLHEKRRLLSLACFNSEDPWALAEYLTSPEHARELYAKVHQADGRMPDFYQVVVKAIFRAQTPIQLEYVTHRVLQ